MCDELIGRRAAAAAAAAAAELTAVREPGERSNGQAKPISARTASFTPRIVSADVHGVTRSKVFIYVLFRGWGYDGAPPR